MSGYFLCWSRSKGAVNTVLTALGCQVIDQDTALCCVVLSSSNCHMLVQLHVADIGDHSIAVTYAALYSLWQQERSTMTQAEVAEFVSSLRRTFTELEALPMPTIAVLEGYAGGGGAELALACDMRVADTKALLAFPEARLGIMPGAGGTQRLARVIGLSAAKVSCCKARLRHPYQAQ